MPGGRGIDVPPRLFRGLGAGQECGAVTQNLMGENTAMEELLWTFEDVVRFVGHPDVPVRRWALERLTKRFADQAGEAVVTLVDDADSYISFMASRFLSETGDRERYGPVLLERLKRAKSTRFGQLAQALARLDQREALPLVVEHLERARRPLDANEFLSLVSALGTFGGDEARQALWEILDGLSKDSLWGGAAIEAMLEAARPEDLNRLVGVYRSWPPSPYGSQEWDAFADALGARRLAQEMETSIKEGLEKTLERAAWWLEREPGLSETCRRGLVEAFGREHQGVFEVLLREAHRLVEERGDDVDGWRRAWESGARTVGYRREALLTPLILEAFAAHPSPSLEQRRRESAMGLALLCQLSTNSDDEGRLDAAEDRTEALLAILSENRQHVLPDIASRVAALGPEIVPRLVAMLDPGDFGWGLIRVVQAVEALARHHPGSCDAAIPALIEIINSEQGDFLLEASSRALEAIGPAAVGPVAAHLRDDDMARQIYLTGVLGEIPTEGAAQTILSWLEDGEPLDEMHIHALTEIGSPSAIEFLYGLWEPGDRLLAESLLILCELNGVQKPELPEWRQSVQAEEERLSRAFDGMDALMEREIPSIPAWLEAPQRREPKPRSVRKPKSISKREHKKRVAQRRARRRKKKKKKKRKR
jgi:hypothetical protein